MLAGPARGYDLPPASGGTGQELFVAQLFDEVVWPVSPGSVATSGLPTLAAPAQPAQVLSAPVETPTVEPAANAPVGDGAAASPEETLEGAAGESELLLPEAADSWYGYIPMHSHVAPLMRHWSGNLELGLDGSEGNTKTFDINVGFLLKRKTKKTDFKFDLDYRKSSTDEIETGNMTFADTRFKRLIGESWWSYYVHNTVVYDEFKNYDVRVTADGGLSLKLIDNGWSELTVRGGAGFSQKIGGDDDEIVPELSFGSDVRIDISKYHAFTGSIDYWPDVSNFSDFRLQIRADLEVVIAEAANLSMKMGILDRYDSNPDGDLPNDLDYMVTLLWNF